MNKKNIILLICAIVIFIIALAVFIVIKNYEKDNKVDNTTKINQTHKDEIIEEEELPTEFNFVDSNGKQYTLNDFSDKPIAILLWRSDSENILDLIALYENYKDSYEQSINFLLINTDEPNTDIENLVNNINFAFPIYYDKDNTAVEKYNYEKLPYMIFINENGEIENTVKETITEDSFTANLDIIAHNY